jgi:nitroreductase
MKEIINKRVSTRAFSEEEMSANMSDSVKKVLFQSHTGIFGNTFHMNYVNTDFMKNHKIKRIGTYGLVTGKPSYVFSTTYKEKQQLVDYGYVFESIVLNLTEIDVETCWLGGTFNRKVLKKVFSLKKEDYIPAVIALGEKPAKIGLVHKIISSNHKRKNFEEIFFEGDIDIPLIKQRAGIYLEVLEAVRLAPSAVNMQPWRIIKSNDRFRFYILKNRNGDMNYLDIGIAICHFDKMMEAINVSGEWKKEEVIDEEGLEYIVSFFAKAI